MAFKAVSFKLPNDEEITLHNKKNLLALNTRVPSFKKPSPPEDPLEAIASMRHEFGEHGGINMSIEASATFMVIIQKQNYFFFKSHIIKNSEHNG